MDLSDMAIHLDDNYFGDNENKIIPTLGNLIKDLSYSTSLSNIEFSYDIRTAVKTSLRKTYFDNKVKLLEQSRFLQTDKDPNEHVLRTKIKEEERKKNLLELFTQDPLDLKLARMEQRLRIVNKEAISYDEIMIRMDQIMERIPDSLKQIFDHESVVDTIDAAGVVEYSQKDLLWEQFAGSHVAIYPKLVLVDKEGRHRMIDKEINQDDQEEESGAYATIMKYINKNLKDVTNGAEKSLEL